MDVLSFRSFSSSSALSVDGASSASSQSAIYQSIHPVSHIYELAQAGVIHGLTFEDLGAQATRWAASCLAQVGATTILCSGLGKTKKEARLLAATKTLKAAERLLDIRNVTITPVSATRRAKENDSSARHAQTARELFWRSGLQLPPVVFVALDLECYELDHSQITEVGIAWSTSDTIFAMNDTVRARHLVIKERLELRNGRFVPDHKGDFLFGESKQISLLDLSRHLSAQLDDLATIGDLILVGHSIAGDIKWLAQEEIMLNVDAVCDIAEVYKATRGDKQATSLGKMAADFGIEAGHLHNAGNDAVYTLKVLKSVMVQAAMKEEGELV